MKKRNIPFVRRLFSDSHYEWMLRNFPVFFMYKKIDFGGVFIWVPKWGLTKRQIENAEKRAIEINEMINWK